MTLLEQIEALVRNPTSEEAAGAVRETARASGSFSEYADAFANRGRLLARLGAKDTAIESYIEAALVYEEELKQIEIAAKLYQSVLDLSPEHRRALFSLGLLLHDLERFEDLVELYRRRLAQCQDDGERTTLHLYIAEVLVDRLDDPEAAFEEMKSASRLAPKNLRIISRLERLGERLQREDEVAVVIGALILDQEDPRVRAGLSLRLAELYQGPLKDRERALAHFRAAVVDSGGNPEILSGVEDVFRERERFAELADLLEEAARDRRVAPHRVRLERELARIYETELGDHKRALAAVSRAAILSPDDRDLIDEVMRLGILNGEMASAAETFEEVAEKTQNSLLRAYLKLKLGHIYGTMLDRPLDAINVYRSILEEDGGHREARRRLSQLYHRVNDQQALVDLLDDELAQQPGNQTQIEILKQTSAMRRDVLHDPAGALEDLQRLLLLLPGDRETLAQIEALSGRLAASVGWSKVPVSGAHVDPSSEGPTDFEGELFGPETETAIDGQVLGGEGQAPLSRDTSHLVEFDRSTFSVSDIVESGAPGQSSPEQAESPLLRSPAPKPDLPVGLAEEIFGHDPSEAQTVSGLEGKVALSAAKAPAPSILDAEPSPHIGRVAGAEAIIRGESDIGPHSGAEQVDDADVIAEAVSISEVQVPAEPRRPERSPRTVLIADPASAPKADASGAPAPVVEQMVVLQQRLQDATRTDDRALQISLLQEITTINEKAGQTERAFFTQARLVRLEVTEARLTDLFRLATSPVTVGPLVETYEELAGRLDLGIQLRFGRELAVLETEKLNEGTRALARLARLHSLAPDDGAVFACWTRLLESSGQWAELAQTLVGEARRLQDPAEARGMAERAAEIREKRLADTSGAADALLAFLDRVPDDEPTWLSCARLLEAAGRFLDLAKLLEQRVYSYEGATRQAIRRRIAAIHLLRLADRSGAERMLRQALSEQPDDGESLSELVGILESREAWPDLVEALVDRTRTVNSARARAQIHRRIAQIAETRLRRIQLAIKHLELAVADDPAELEALLDLERLRRAEGDWPGVAQVLELRTRALSDSSARADVWVEIARIRKGPLANPNGAREAYQDALALLPKHRVALLELSSLFEEQGDANNALSRLRSLVDELSGAEQAQVRVRIGRLLELNFRRTDEAALEYRRGLDSDPQCLEAISALRRIKEAAQDFPTALGLCIQEAELVLDERLQAQLFAQAGELALHRVNDRARALTCFERAWKADPEDLASEASLGKLLEEQGDTERAYTHLSRSARGLKGTDPTRALDLFIRAANCARDQENEPEVMAAYREALALSPRALEPLKVLGELLERAKDWEACHETNASLLLHHEPSLEVTERSAVYLRMARAKHQLKDLESAIRLARRAAEIGEGRLEPLVLLAEVLAEDGRPLEAAECLRALSQQLKDPQKRRAFLVRACKLIGDEAKALEPAIDLAAELHLLHTADVEIADLLARYRERARDYAGAAEALIRTAKKNSGRPRADLLVRAARALAETERHHEEPKNLLLEACEIAPTHPEGLKILSVKLEYEEQYAPLAELSEDAGMAFVKGEHRPEDLAGASRQDAALRCLAQAKQLYRFQLDRPEDALRVLRAERELVPDRPGLRDEHARLLDEAARASQNGSSLREEAIAAWSEIIEEEPGCLEALRRLYSLRLELGQTRLARLAAELLVALNEANDAERKLFEAEYGGGLNPPAPQVRGARIEVPAHPSEKSPLQPLFSELGYAPLHAFPDAWPEVRPRKKDRVQLGDLGPRVGATLLNVCGVLGKEVPPVYARDDAPAPVVPSFLDGSAVLTVSLALATQVSEAKLRFQIARVMSLLRPRALCLTLLPIGVLREGLEGLALDRVTEDLLFSESKVSRRRGKALEKALPQESRSKVVEQVVRWLKDPRRVSLQEEKEAVLRTADRAGLIACGSPLVAVDALKEAGKVERSWLMPLIEFSASRAFSNIVGKLS